MLALVGAALRLLVMLTYSSAVFIYYNGDSIRYARIPVGGFHPGLFGDPAAPAGYPLFLAALRLISHRLWVTVTVQHCLGLATALLLYAGVRRFGAPRVVALVPAALVLLSGDQIFLEHSLLTEPVWGFVVVLGLYSLLRANVAAGDRARWGWLAAAGAALAAAVLIRQAALALPVVGVGWAAIVLQRGAPGRIRAAVAVALPAVALLVVYVAVAHLAGGTSGLNSQSGFQLYGRVAQFADCSRFTPPGRTRLLCQTIPPSQRPGPTDYLFGPGEPLRAVFHVRLPQDSGLLGQFAKQAILHQPLGYAGAVLEDYGRIVGLDHARPGDGADSSTMRFDLRVPFGSPGGETTPAAVANYYRPSYAAIRPYAKPGWASRWGDYQSVFRLHELLVIPLLLLAIVGVLLGRGALRAGIGLFLTAALALYALPPLVALWDVRYSVLPGELLVAAAAAGAWTCGRWVRYERRSHTLTNRGRVGAGVTAPPPAPARQCSP